VLEQKNKKRVRDVSYGSMNRVFGGVGNRAFKFMSKLGYEGPAGPGWWLALRFWGSGRGWLEGTNPKFAAKSLIPFSPKGECLWNLFGLQRGGPTRSFGIHVLRPGGGLGGGLGAEIGPPVLGPPPGRAGGATEGGGRKTVWVFWAVELRGGGLVEKAGQPLPATPGRRGRKESQGSAIRAGRQFREENAAGWGGGGGDVGPREKQMGGPGVGVGGREAPGEVARCRGG